MSENQSNVDSLISPSQYAEKLEKFLGEHDPSFGYSEGMAGWENQAQVINTFTAMLEAGDVQWFANVLDLLEKDDPTLSDQIEDMRQSLQKYGLAAAERGEAGERNSISGIKTNAIEHAQQPIAEITINYGGGFIDEASYSDPEDFKRALREYVYLHSARLVGYSILNDDMSLRYYAEKLMHEEYDEYFPPMNQWQYEKGLSESEKDQFREKLAFIYQKEDIPEWKDARMISQPDKGNFIINSIHEQISPDALEKAVNLRFEQHRLTEQLKKKQSALEKELANLDKQIAKLTIAPQQESVIPKTPPIAELILHSPGGGLETCTYIDPEAFKKDLREEIDIRGITSVSANVLNDDQDFKYFVAKTRYEEYGEQFPPMNQWQYEKGLSEAEKTQFREKLTFIYRQEDSPEFKDARLVSEPDMDNFIISDAFAHIPSAELGEKVNQHIEVLRSKQEALAIEMELNLSKEISLSNQAFDGDNYLHFTATVDHQEFEGLFRVHDPVNGPSMQIVSIDQGWRNPAIEAQWPKLTENLREYSQGKYGELIAQENPGLTAQMRDLGQIPYYVDGFSEDFLMWKDIVTGKKHGYDGWDCVASDLRHLKNEKALQPKRSIKDRLADAKAKCAQLNAERQAGRLAKQKDVTR